MKIIEPSFCIEDIDYKKILKNIERAARVCYKSEENITEHSAEIFIKKIIELGHESVLEHEKITTIIVCDRGVSHELVRHRIASYSQESTRYCNYSKDKFNNQLTFIKPCFWSDDSNLFKIWKIQMEQIEKNYMEMIKFGAKPQEARSILPNSLKTEIAVTMNIREWRHFFKVRTTKAAHPQIREISINLLNEFKKNIPIIFDDIIVEG